MAQYKLSEEKRKIFAEKCRQTKLERYGDPNYNNMSKNKQTKLERYGDINYNNQAKHKQTCLERYGVDHHNKVEENKEKIRKAKLTAEVQEKYENTMLERYGNKNANLVPSIANKRKNSLIQHYGVDNPLKNKDIKERQLQTLKANGSYTKSKLEEELYKYLITEYQKDDIIRQYKDLRYPFNCDFYIKSEDMFIEVNGHPSHGEHPFDSNNENDLKVLEDLKFKNTDWSKMIIDVWTKRDVEKFQCAKNNNLNYKVIYKDINEIINE